MRVVFVSECAEGFVILHDAVAADRVLEDFRQHQLRSRARRRLRRHGPRVRRRPACPASLPTNDVCAPMRSLVGRKLRHRRAGRARWWRRPRMPRPRRRPRTCPTVSSDHEKRLHADCRQQPERRLVSGDAAISRGPDHRAAGLGAERNRQHARRDRGRGARRRAARRVRGIARVAGGGRLQARELGGDGLAEDHAAGPPHRHDHGGIGSSADGRHRSASRRRSGNRRCRRCPSCRPAGRAAASAARLSALRRAASMSSAVNAPISPSRAAIASAHISTTARGVEAPASIRRARSSADSIRPSAPGVRRCGR